MRLSEFVKKNKETQDDYYNRTVWYDIVIEQEPFKVISLQQARDYMETLTPSTHRYHIPKADETKPAPTELLKIETETLGEDPTETRWIDSGSGEEIHCIRKD